MAARGNDRDLLEQVLLAGLGAVSLTAERIEQLADSLAERGGIRRDDARAAIDELVTRWRGDATRATERAGAGRVAQLEHRVKLLEREETVVLPPSSQS